MSARSDWGVLVLAAVVALPLEPLALYLVRLPLHGWLSATLGPSALLTALTLFYAPLTEEPAKWLTLLLPPIRRRLRPDNAVAIALAVGMGFGIGELWLLALQIANIPALAALPFYAFGGFLVERAVVCFIHGGMIAFCLPSSRHRALLYRRWLDRHGAALCAQFSDLSRQHRRVRDRTGCLAAPADGVDCGLHRRAWYRRLPARARSRPGERYFAAGAHSVPCLLTRAIVA